MLFAHANSNIHSMLIPKDYYTFKGKLHILNLFGVKYIYFFFTNVGILSLKDLMKDLNFHYNTFVANLLLSMIRTEVVENL